MRAYDYTLTYAYAHKGCYTVMERLAYVVYVPNKLTNVGVRCVSTLIKYISIYLRYLSIRRDQINFLDMFKNFQRMRAYIIYAIHTLTIRTTYAGYASHTVDIRLIRCRYVAHTH